MFEINALNAKIWSRLGSRGTFGAAILALAERTESLRVLSADLGDSSGLARLRSAFPEKFINVGIAEQNLIGIAAGLAKEGFTVFATSFAPFIGIRAGEQIRMNLGYMQLGVKAVAIGSGLAMGKLGNSHYGTEDMALVRAIPNMVVLCPADGAEICKAVFAAAEDNRPMYIRLTGETNNPIVYQSDYEFEIGKAIELKKGSDVAIIACGSMVYQSLKAAEILQANGIDASVYNMHTIKPLDTSVIDRSLKCKHIVTVEEHSVIGGLGSAVAEYKSTLKSAPPQIKIGLPDSYEKAGTYEFLLDKHGLTAQKIAERILNA